MRRFHVGLAILAFALLAPTGARADDRQIAEDIVKKLQVQKDSGALQNFSIDLKVKEGSVFLKGYVTQPEHEKAAIEVARRVQGVQRVYNELEVRGSPASTAQDEATRASQFKSVLKKLNNALIGTGRKTSLTRLATHSSQSRPTTRDNSKRIAEEIVEKMREEMRRGKLRGFGVDVEVDKGVVTLKGRVSAPEQRDLALGIARKVAGATKVIDNLKVQSEAQPEPQPEQAPVASLPSSDDIAREVISRLKHQKQTGGLKKFGIDVSVEGGVVWMSGHVASEQQRLLALDQARYVRGVKQVVNDISIKVAPAPTVAAAAPLTPAPEPPQLPQPEVVSNLQPAAPTPATPEPVSREPQAPALLAQSPAPAAPAVPYGYVPIQYVAVPAARAGQAQVPLPFAPARPVNHQAAVPSASPMPMSPGGVGIAPARFDHPQLPGYAWPSYAPHPNYGAVTYPKQYSPAAWPYIGPFYPYPQVPLGWRKVTLEWDDGWWQLDFKSR